MLKLELHKHYSYNAQTGVIKFFNGSEIYLRDLFLYPSDPEFVALGSTEYTDGFIDEMGEITEQAYQIIRSRIRYKLDEFGLIPKLAMGSNPCKTFVYREFYKKWITNKLEPYKAYIPASVYDNPFISKHYITNLKKLDRVNRERLLNGNWEYDEDPLKLFDYDKILDMFTNSPKIDGKKYCTVDVAGRGRDKTIIMIWDNLHITKIIIKENISNTELILILGKYNVPRSNCIVDEDGVGFGLKKDTPGVKGFVNNSKAIKSKREAKGNEQNYQHLKAQCWFTLAHYVNSGLISTYEMSQKVKNLLIEDLEQMKQKDADKDTPLKVITKEELKENIGRSTDVGDALMMRMYFELKPKVLTI